MLQQILGLACGEEVQLGVAMDLMLVPHVSGRTGMQHQQGLAGFSPGKQRAAFAPVAISLAWQDSARV